MRVLKADGTTINPVRDERYEAHTGGHLKVTLTSLDTAQRLTSTVTKVKWAIICSKDYAFRWGFSSSIKQSTAIGQHIGSGGSVAVEYCDLRDIYFIDSDGTNKPVLQVEYVEEA
jgi:fructose-1,6-bisphosphatase/inositol monophosphatase family enzyme